jgi:hypothetical protein
MNDSKHRSCTKGGRGLKKRNYYSESLERAALQWGNLSAYLPTKVQAPVSPVHPICVLSAFHSLPVVLLSAISAIYSLPIVLQLLHAGT